MKKIYILGIILFLTLGLLGGNIIGNIAFNPPKSINNNIENNNFIGNITNNSSNLTWHKIGTYNGVDDDIISFNAKGSKIRIISTGMPIKNYASNYLISTLQQNGITLSESESAWNSRSAVATKTKTIEVSGSGNFNIEISAYELQWWTLEVYEYY